LWHKADIPTGLIQCTMLENPSYDPGRNEAEQA